MGLIRNSKGLRFDARELQQNHRRWRENKREDDSFIVEGAGSGGLFYAKSPPEETESPTYHGFSLAEL